VLISVIIVIVFSSFFFHVLKTSLSHLYGFGVKTFAVKLQEVISRFLMHTNF